MPLPKRAQTEGTRGVDPDVVRIGADIVELLTSGMYVSPITVFREYVQNAADAIDDARRAGLIGETERGQVVIDFDHTNRNVWIRDNGGGIPRAQVADVLLAIGGSGKRGTAARGFRGVGRLSGLAYCRQLEFRTKAAGEDTVSTVSWDARALRAGIADAGQTTDLREVIARAVTITETPAADPQDHFFEVKLQGVVRHRQDALINEHAVSAYLGQVAPVPFADEFSFGSEIEKALSTFFPGQVPIELLVGGTPVRRPYRDALAQPGTDKTLDIREVEFFQLLDVDGEVGAVGWLGHHDYIRSISTTLGVRGLRARVGDVQVGEADLFDSSYRESRFNGWAIGELHIVDRRLVPNGRRDNFEVNHHASNLLVQLGPIALQISQRCRTSSISRNASTIIRNTIADAEALAAEERMDRARLSRVLAAIERGLAKLRAVTEEDQREGFRVDLLRFRAALSAKTPTSNAGIIASEEAVALVNRIVTNRAQANRLVEELLRLKA